MIPYNQLSLEDIFSDCQDIYDSDKADMTIFDSSGIEAWVMENNPKYANRIIKQLKAYAKAHNFDDNYDPYKAAYNSMPSHSASNPEIKLLYIDGHFCYAYKVGIVTNGLGIIRHLAFYNKDFFLKHPEIVIAKKSDAPNKDKFVHDARLLIPTLQDFFRAHPLINPKTFLGDAAFDSVKLYKDLLSGDTFGTDASGNGIHFSKPSNFLTVLFFHLLFSSDKPNTHTKLSVKYVNFQIIIKAFRNYLIFSFY